MLKPFFWRLNMFTTEATWLSASFSKRYEVPLLNFHQTPCALADFDKPMVGVTYIRDACICIQYVFRGCIYIIYIIYMYYILLILFNGYLTFGCILHIWMSGNLSVCDGKPARMMHCIEIFVCWWSFWSWIGVVLETPLTKYEKYCSSKIVSS